MVEVEISRGALQSNARALRGLAGKAQVAAVVKGNAYGHGLAETVASLEDLVDAFQVDDIEELRRLRELTGKRALVFGYVQKSDLREAIDLGCELTLYDLERIPVLREIGAARGERVRVHLKFDCLLGRQGVLPSEAPQILAALSHAPEIEVVGAYTHFADIEDSEDLSHALEQAAVFDALFAQAESALGPLGRHLSATSGLMTYEALRPNDLVRLGIGLYGLYPSARLEIEQARLGLRPVMRWRTKLAQVKTVPAGFPIGYGRTFVTERETRIGIVPCGYSDGLVRAFSNSGEVLVGGIRRRILGRVAMNMFAVDLSEGPAPSQEDEVVLLGAQGEERLTAEELAAKIRTINYEITTLVSPLLTRTVSP